MSSPSISILLAGGGTGGHLWPGVAVAQEIARLHPQAQITFFVPGKPVDQAIMATTSFCWYTNPMRPLPEAITKLPDFLGRFWRGWGRTLEVFRRSRPHVVVGLGGYGAFSSALLSHLYDIPLLLLESNAKAGKVVRWCAKFGQAVYSSGEIAGVESSKIKATGIPIRSNLPVDKEPRSLVNNQRQVTILVMGGSQGAQCINRAMGEAVSKLTHLTPHLNIIHLGGNASENLVSLYAKYGIRAQVMAFCPQMGELYRQADIAICRAGGSTLAELQILGIPAILIPLARAAEDHQMANAQAMAKAGAALVVSEAELTGELLAKTVTDLLAQPDKLYTMATRAKALGKPHAAQEIAQDILQYARG